MSGSDLWTDILVPAAGIAMTEATVSRWLVAVGDEVQVDQPIVEIETDKTLMEVQAASAGVIASIDAAVNEVVAVGARLATIRPANSGAPSDSGLSRPVVPQLEVAPADGVSEHREFLPDLRHATEAERAPHRLPPRARFGVADPARSDMPAATPFQSLDARQPVDIGSSRPPLRVGGEQVVTHVGLLELDRAMAALRAIRAEQGEHLQVDDLLVSVVARSLALHVPRLAEVIGLAVDGPEGPAIYPVLDAAAMSLEQISSIRRALVDASWSGSSGSIGSAPEVVIHLPTGQNEPDVVYVEPPAGMVATVSFGGVRHRPVCRAESIGIRVTANLAIGFRPSRLSIMELRSVWASIIERLMT